MKHKSNILEAHKLSWQQAEMLILIDDHSKMDSIYWTPPNHVVSYRNMPPANPMNYSPTLGRDVIVYGAGTAKIISSLARRGLIEFHPEHAGRYWARIKEDGRLLIERWRESKTWPVKVTEEARAGY